MIYPDEKFGPRNFGVTDYSLENARQTLFDTLRQLNFETQSLRNSEKMEVIENIDIRLLDEGHVIPNMGIVTQKGVWFPNLATYLVENS